MREPLIRYKIRELDPNIFTIVVKNKKHRALLFMRTQEYFESTNKKLYRKTFSIKTFDAVHPIEKYVEDWSGYNFPYNIAVECYDKLRKRPEYITKYDELFYNILDKLKSMKSPGKAYIIGIGDISTYKHEKAQALYHINPEYKKLVCRLHRWMPKSIYLRLTRNLKKMGYIDSVLDDELQAYIVSSDWNNNEFIKNISKEDVKLLNSIYNYFLQPFGL